MKRIFTILAAALFFGLCFGVLFFLLMLGPVLVFDIGNGAAEVYYDMLKVSLCLGWFVFLGGVVVFIMFD